MEACSKVKLRTGARTAPECMGIRVVRLVHLCLVCRVTRKVVDEIGNDCHPRVCSGLFPEIEQARYSIAKHKRFPGVASGQKRLRGLYPLIYPLSCC